MVQSYECMNCDYRITGDSRRLDGTDCPKCQGPILPVDEHGKVIEKKPETITTVLLQLIDLVGEKKADELLQMYMAQRKQYYLVYQALLEKCEELKIYILDRQ